MLEMTHNKTRSRPRPRELAFQGSLPLSNWLVLHDLSRATWYRMVAAGQAPRVIRVGVKILITAEADRDWRVAMEATA